MIVGGMYMVNNTEIWLAIDASFSDVISSLIHKPNRACLNLAGLYFYIEGLSLFNRFVGLFQEKWAAIENN